MQDSPLQPMSGLHLSPGLVTGASLCVWLSSRQEHSSSATSVCLGGGVVLHQERGGTPARRTWAQTPALAPGRGARIPRECLLEKAVLPRGTERGPARLTILTMCNGTIITTQ